MSDETLRNLNTQQLIGETDKRGFAWHFAAELQGDEPNHYPAFIPVEDVIRRLFNFVVNEVPLYVPSKDGMVEVPDRKAMVTSDTNEVLGIFKAGYQGHDYEEWLLTNIANLIGADLGIVGAGLLRNRAQAWVQVATPETLTHPCGLVLLPFILGCTSFDGSLASTFNIKSKVVVCDNTLTFNLKASEGAQVKIKHSKYSNFRVANMQQALGIVQAATQATSDELTRLCSMEVSDKAYGAILDALVPVPEDASNKRGVTVADDKRQQITALYRHDDRSAPWQGTALGVVQAFNTYSHHYAQVRGDVHRAQRNAENMVNDKFGKQDNLVISTIESVLAN